MQPIMQFVGNLGYVGVAISGGLLAIRGTIGVGEIQAFIQYVRNLLSRSSRLRRWQICCSRWLQPPSAYLNFWTKRKKN